MILRNPPAWTKASPPAWALLQGLPGRKWRLVAPRTIAPPAPCPGRRRKLAMASRRFTSTPTALTQLINRVVERLAQAV